MGNDGPAQAGVLAIRGALGRIYGSQAPRDFTTAHRWRMGGPDPLDNVTLYRAEKPRPHWHFVTFGFSELYEKESDDASTSGWGFEISWRIARAVGENQPPGWAVGFLQNLARVVFEQSRPFRAGALIDFGAPIVAGLKTKITALVWAPDPELKEIQTPNGKLQFLIPVGISSRDVPPPGSKAEALLARLSRENPMFLTDL